MAAMVSRILRSRIAPYLSRKPLISFARIHDGPALSEPIAAAAVAGASHNDQTPPSPPAAAGPKKFWVLLLFGLYTTVGAASYITYEYTLDEVKRKKNDLRKLSEYSVREDASILEKYKALVCSSAIKVPVKTLELYIASRRFVEGILQIFGEPVADKLLPDLPPEQQNVLTLVLDLNETLVYSDWRRERGWRTFKRPGVDAFLNYMKNFYEIVVYSDQLFMYIGPVLERLIPDLPPTHKLSRAANRYVNGKYCRDLSNLNRDPSKILYVSGHSLESCLQQENCVPVKPWTLEIDDTALLDLIPFLEYVARNRTADIRAVLTSYRGHDIPIEFIKRMEAVQRWKNKKRVSGG